MSIFPKRTLQGATITIHWNFNTSKLKQNHIFPLVRIGVEDPNGKVTMLLEKHILALPSPDKKKEAEEQKKLLYLNKNFPLLLVASYLSGKNTKEKLADILENIQGGRHFYFNYYVSENAPLGKYTLISEVISNGEVRYSKTAEDDFFFVEKVNIKNADFKNNTGNALIVNESPEPTPVKVMAYFPGKEIQINDVQVFELGAHETKEIQFNSPFSYLIYNEEREIIPLATNKTTLRNPHFLSVEKEEENSTYIFNREEEEGYVLDGITRRIWQHADGLENLNTKDDEHVYKEMLSNNIIHEIDLIGSQK